MTINVENARKLADFIKSGKHPWNINSVQNCFFGQFRAMFAPVFQQRNVLHFLGIADDNTGAAHALTQPQGRFDHPHSFSREKAVQVLNHLIETGGEVKWDLD